MCYRPVMRQVDSKYRQFPIALEYADLPKERRDIRTDLMIEWTQALNLHHNVDYLFFQYLEGHGHRAKSKDAIAFKKKDHALLFKLKFASV